MGAQTIPEPHQDEITAAASGICCSADRFGIDLNTPGMKEFVDHLVAFRAQQSAEIRWLRNILHTPGGVHDR